MEMLKLRCHFKLLLITLLIIACLIAYKFVIIQRYISTYNDGENHYAGFLRQKAAAHYYGNNLVGKYTLSSVQLDSSQTFMKYKHKLY